MRGQIDTFLFMGKAIEWKLDWYQGVPADFSAFLFMGKAIEWKLLVEIELHHFSGTFLFMGKAIEWKRTAIGRLSKNPV